MNLDHLVRVPTIPRPGATVLARSLTTSPGGKSSDQAAARLLGGDVELTMTDGVAAAVAAADVVLLALEVPVETVAACARHGAASGATVVLNLSPYQSVPRGLLQDCFVVVVNEHELLEVLPGQALPGADEGWSPVMADLAGAGTRRAVVTLGPDGAVVLDSGHAARVLAPRIRAVDTTGSGDAFGALGYGLSVGLDLVEAAELGARVGACAATRPGARPSYPTRSELEEWTADRATAPGQT